MKNKIFFSVFFLVAPVLINILIAMMDETQEETHEKHNEWIRQWGRTCLAVEQNLNNKEKLLQKKKYTHRLSNDLDALVVRWTQTVIIFSLLFFYFWLFKYNKSFFFNLNRMKKEKWLSRKSICSINR